MDVIHRAYVIVQFSIQEQLLIKNVEQLRGGLVFEARSSSYHSTLGSRVIKKKKDHADTITCVTIFAIGIWARIWGS